MLNILHIIPSLRKGGAERLVLNICNELQKKDNIRVKLVVLHPDNEYEFLSKDIDIEVCNSKVEPSVCGKSRVDILDFEKIFFDFKPHIIHSHLFEAEILSRWKLLSNVRYFTHCHDNMRQLRAFNFKTILSKKLFTNYYEKQIMIKRYIACNNNFIAISKDVENYFVQVLPGQLKKNVVLLNNAIDYDRFKFSKAVLFHGTNAINLISIGSLSELKNHLFLVEVMNIFNKRGIRTFNLTIIGEGMLRSEIENKIFDYNLENMVSLIGLTDKVEELLKKADIYVYSCIKEGFGLTLLEAMASGLPVVCLDGGGNRDIMEDGKNGYIIHEQNPELFADKIMELTTNKQLYSEISQYAREFAQKYDINGYIDNLVKIYNTKLN